MNGLREFVPQKDLREWRRLVDFWVFDARRQIRQPFTGELIYGKDLDVIR